MKHPPCLNLVGVVPLTACALMLTLCSSCCSPLPIAPTVCLDGESTAALIELAVGETVRIELPGNSGTGFEWSILKYDSVVSITSAPAVAQEPGRAGGPTTWMFVMQGVRPGPGRVEFGYARPWETDQAPAKKQVVPVRVDAGR
ncbi:MAG: hypothetical protein EXS00_08020 [Phycisphaerales bacterium]|nr:hypothetical protein [Phycisphaerales bacterium]